MGEYAKMRFAYRMKDIIVLQVKRILNQKKYVLRVSFNIAISLCICELVLNIGFNINAYLTRQFFSSAEIRKILIEEDTKKINIEDTWLQDDRIQEYRMITAAKIPMEKIDCAYDTEFTTFDITVFENYTSIFFEDEYQVERAKETEAIKKGILVNSKYAELLGEDVIGTKATFSYCNKKYMIPIVGIIDAIACENFSPDYQAAMYVSQDCLKADSPKCDYVELEVKNYKDVISFVDEFDSDGYSVNSQYEDAERGIYVLKLVDVIIAALVFVFVMYSITGTANAMQALNDEKKKNITLLTILGYGRHQLYVMEGVENLFVGCFSGMFGGLLSYILTKIISYSKLLAFSEISSELVFRYNFSVWFIGMGIGVFITMVCSFKLLHRNLKQDVIAEIKSIG